MSKTIVEQVFSDLKDKKEHIDDESLQRFYNSACSLASKYKAAGQKAAFAKLAFVISTVEKERKLINLGYTTYVDRENINEYIDNCTAETAPVKIIEVANYVREIPDEIVQKIEQTKDLFDEFFVVYTDYTNSEDKRIEANQRAHDPILFGAFINVDKRVCLDRFYYLGDWIDDYCDLTLDKLITKLSDRGIDAKKSLYTPMTVDEVSQYAKEAESQISISSMPILSYQGSYLKPTMKPSIISRIVSKIKSLF